MIQSIFNEFKNNTGESDEYKKILQLIDEKKTEELTIHVEKYYPNNCYKTIKDCFISWDCSLSQFIFCIYPHSLAEEIYKYEEFKKIGGIETEYERSLEKEFHSEIAYVVPENILKMTHVEELSKYFTGYDGVECVLKYIFCDSEEYCITGLYSQLHASIIKKLFEKFDFNYLKQFFNELDYYFLRNDGREDFYSFIRSFQYEEAQHCFGIFMKIFSPKEFAALYFEDVYKNDPSPARECYLVNDMEELYFHYYSILKYSSKSIEIERVNNKIKNLSDYEKIVKSLKRISPHKKFYTHKAGGKWFYISSEVSFQCLQYEPYEVEKFLASTEYPQVENIRRHPKWLVFTPETQRIIDNLIAEN